MGKGVRRFQSPPKTEQSSIFVTFFYLFVSLHIFPYCSYPILSKTVTLSPFSLICLSNVNLLYISHFSHYFLFGTLIAISETITQIIKKTSENTNEGKVHEEDAGSTGLVGSVGDSSP
jgi:hypothetical protein